MSSTCSLAESPGPHPWQGLSEAEFEGLVRREEGRLRRVLLSFTGGDTEAAGVLAQECFLRAWGSRHRYRGEAPAESWLLSIALNLARDERKSRRQGFWRRVVRNGETGLEPPDRAPSPESVLLSREALARVEAALDALPARQRQVARLRFVEEAPLEEIASRLGVTVGSVKVHLSRAVSALRRARDGARPASVGRSAAGLLAVALLLAGALAGLLPCAEEDGAARTGRATVSAPVPQDDLLLAAEAAVLDPAPRALAPARLIVQEAPEPIPGRSRT